MDDINTQQKAAFAPPRAAEVTALSPSGTRQRLPNGERLFQAGDEPRTVTVHPPCEFAGNIDILTGRTTVVSAVTRGDKVPHDPRFGLGQYRLDPVCVVRYHLST